MENTSNENRLVVDPITRIEGHLRIEAEMEGNTIKQAYSSGTSVRGIELILQGRDPRDAWAFAQRICGVCTLVHGMASVRAVEDAIRKAWRTNANLGVAIGKNVLFRLKSLLLRAVFLIFATKLLARGTGLSA